MEIQKEIPIYDLNLGLNLGLDLKCQAGQIVSICSGCGQGKTTLSTIVANNLYRGGANILHIFGQDNLNVILNKHNSALTGEKLNVKSRDVCHISNVTSTPNGGSLILRKVNYDDDITGLISKPEIDVVVIDSIHNINYTKLQQIAFDYNLLIIITEQIVRHPNNNIGVGLCEIQDSSLVICIGNTIKQKELKLATITVVKNRNGISDVSRNVYFDPSTVQIRRLKFLDKIIIFFKKLQRYVRI